jgi:hypothetical protein
MVLPEFAPETSILVIALGGDSDPNAVNCRNQVLLVA